MSTEAALKRFARLPSGKFLDILRIVAVQELPTSTARVHLSDGSDKQLWIDIESKDVIALDDILTKFSCCSGGG